MRCPLPLNALALSLALGLAGAAHAAKPAQLAELLKQLTERVNKLEAANAQLQRELAASRAAPPATLAMVPSRQLEQRVQALEQQQTQLADSLEGDTISEKEPELSARLKALETQTQGMSSAVGRMQALDGVKTSVSLAMVAQQPLGENAPDGQLKYRADAVITLPLESLGDTDQSLFAHFRLGQGAGLQGLPALHGNPNATAFQVNGLGPDSAVALLAQAGYQASIPLPLGGFKPQSRQTLEFTVGKLDPFVYFDQNAVAGDESRQFLNSVFVHNPLLDAGGDIGVDGNGFAPGLRVALIDSHNRLERWSLSLGLFGAGERGANYQASLSKPLTLVQAETQQRLFGGLLGNYRAYAWHNPQAVPFALELPLQDAALAAPEHHSGWGLSVDQRVGDGTTLFARWGQQHSGQVKFDRALTLGLETNGSSWARGGDTVGLALGWLRTSDAYRAYAAADVAAPRTLRDAEQVAEVYYRWRVAKQFELTPSLQVIAQGGGESGVGDVRIFSLRSLFSF